MRKAKRRSRALFTALLCGSWLALSYACAVDDSNPVVARREINLGSGLGPDGESLQDANGAPICASYGGSSVAKQIALAVLQNVKIDCRISATVVSSTTANHGIQCFQNFVAASFQCDGATLQGGYKDDQGVVCTRPVDDTLSDEDFDAFVDVYKQTLATKGVSDADIALIAPALLAARAFVVGGDVQSGKYTKCSGNCKDAGAACVRDAGPPPPKDAGGVDAKADTGAPKDAGPKDTGTPDTGSSSGGPQDAGTDADTGT